MAKRHQSTATLCNTIPCVCEHSVWDNDDGDVLQLETALETVLLSAASSTPVPAPSNTFPIAFSKPLAMTPVPNTISRVSLRTRSR
uniref:Uncharacterized protein n=1 Tax=Mycena chlorophos TaxID=658473 RepID=A0ABQ0L980_MYCCL|nr:predicted protein [Mycena chlorophos]